MARQQIKGDQIQNGSIQPRSVAGLYGPFEIVFQTTSSSRSTVGNTLTAMPGAIGDTSYTAPSDQNMTLSLIMTQMTYRTAGTTRCYISINGVKQAIGTYTTGVSWELQTIQMDYNVNAGDTVTIGCIWYNSSGTATVTNDVTDQSYMNGINYTAMPRNP